MPRGAAGRRGGPGWLPDATWPVKATESQPSTVDACGLTSSLSRYRRPAECRDFQEDIAVADRRGCAGSGAAGRYWCYSHDIDGGCAHARIPDLMDQALSG
jgi:hypothetical protein